MIILYPHMNLNHSKAFRSLKWYFSKRWIALWKFKLRCIKNKTEKIKDKALIQCPMFWTRLISQWHWISSIFLIILFQMILYLLPKDAIKKTLNNGYRLVTLNISSKGVLSWHYRNKEVEKNLEVLVCHCLPKWNLSID